MTHTPNVLLPFTAEGALAMLRDRMSRDARRNPRLGIALACQRAFTQALESLEITRDKGTVRVIRPVTHRRIPRRLIP